MKRIKYVGCTLLCATHFTTLAVSQQQDINKYQQTDQAVLSDIESYVNGLSCLSASFYENNSHNSGANKGHIYIKRASINKKTAVKINYETGDVLSVSLNGRFLTVTNRKTKKSRTYSILTTPLYSVLAGKLDFKNFDYTIAENTVQCVKVQIVYEKQTFVLNFSKCNGRVNKLLSWNVSSDKGWAVVTFDSKDYHENDQSKIPNSVFNRE